MDDYPPLRKTAIWLFCLLTLTVALGPVSDAVAHGGDEAKRAHQTKSVEQPRIKPTEIRLLTTIELSKAVESSDPPPDIAIVRCTLNAHAPCRGVSLSLTDSQSTLVREVNSGTDGMIGFEGLTPGERYTISIRSDRYAGRAEIASGRFWNLNGDRVE